MKPQKFSKKINIIVVILILLTGISIGGYLVLKSKISQADFLKQVAQDLNEQKLIDDPDHDGLKDWEEKIYQTNPNKSDTDGDGYLDGEEVAAGYDPTKPAPNDQLADNSGQTSQLIRPEPGNLTQILGYILSHQMRFEPLPPLANLQDVNSLESTLESVMDEKIVQALEKSSTNFLAEFMPPFQEGQFEITPDNNLAAIQNYTKKIAEKIGWLDSCQDINNLQDEAEIIQQSIETKNFKQVSCLANSYLQAYQELIKIPVPLDWLNIHRKLLTILWDFHKVHQYLPEYEKDPLKGVLVIEKFEETSKNFAQLFKEIKADLDNR